MVLSSGSAAPARHTDARVQSTQSVAFLLLHLSLNFPTAQAEQDVARGPAQLPGGQGSQPDIFVWAADAVVVEPAAL